MRSTWLSPRAVGLHVALAVTVPGFLSLGWWQLHRALAGNGLSWAYTVEWPFFCCYAVYMWWRLVHDIGADRTRAEASRPLETQRVADTAVVAPERHTSDAERTEDDEDRELAAYNRYLASLNDSNDAKRW